MLPKRLIFPALVTQRLLESVAVFPGHEVVEDGVDRACEVIENSWWLW